LQAFFPFAGFFSKDLILEVAFAQHTYILWSVLWVTAGLTAFYSFRLIMYVFYGKAKFDHEKAHPHETYPFVIAAMTPLAILAISAGWFENQFVEMVTKVLPELNIHLNSSTFYILIALTTAIALCGIALAIFKFKKDGEYYSSTFKHRFIYKLLINQYYLPHFWDFIVGKTYRVISKFSWKKIDIKGIDNLVDGLANRVIDGSKLGTSMQSGNLSGTLQWMGFGILILLIFVLIFSNIR